MEPMIIVGTRPEIVKMAPVAKELEKRGIRYFLLHTGQHYSEFMSQSFFEDLGLRAPDLNLQIGSGTHAQQTAKALVGIEEAILNETPDVVLVQGDTNAVLSATLAAVKVGVPVGHVEAGLRSHDRRMPEEYNRRLTDHASDFLFAPTEVAAEILERENVWGKVVVTGNTVIDALEERLPIAREQSNIMHEMDLEDFALLTLHRAENVDDRTTLEGLVNGLAELEVDIIFPAHPRTVSRLKQFQLMERVKQSSIRIIQPVGYLDFLVLLDSCRFVLTDSGGIQEEVTAPSLNKKVFVLRNSTERPEAIESGHSTLVGTDPMGFPDAIRHELRKGVDEERKSPYGSGDAAERIINTLLAEIA
ncbi:UDP-N-acetylglucosamine 2-epimerase (non-hydrolyzing) [Candidatus Thorarchaeota archaeon]|nr:MAG: UDP-N-acetylglucosamine 2-epimerase (non-hydrolyzing) [Candidatus Thorarchaeota archaeon]